MQDNPAPTEAIAHIFWNYQACKLFGLDNSAPTEAMAHICSWKDSAYKTFCAGQFRPNRSHCTRFFLKIWSMQNISCLTIVPRQRPLHTKKDNLKLTFLFVLDISAKKNMKFMKSSQPPLGNFLPAQVGPNAATMYVCMWLLMYWFVCLFVPSCMLLLCVSNH